MEVEDEGGDDGDDVENDEDEDMLLDAATGQPLERPLKRRKTG